MKTNSVSLIAAGVSTLGLFLALTGCSQVPTRQATLEASFTASPAPASRDMGLQLPVPQKTVKPFYPLDQRRAGITGEVTLNCRIDEKGNVHDPVLENASDEAFVQPAMLALKDWKFQPARRDGVPVAVRASIPIHFTLAD